MFLVRHALQVAPVTIRRDAAAKQAAPSHTAAVLADHSGDYAPLPIAASGRTQRQPSILLTNCRSGV